MSVAGLARHRLEKERRSRAVIALVVLLLVLAIGAVQGGVVMIIDPQTPFGMTTEVLEESPVDDFTLPGLFLIGVSIGSLLTAVGMAISWPWRWVAALERRLGYRWPWVAAMTVGVLLLAFELAELFLIPFHPVLHPLFIAWSLAILGLGWRTRRRFAAG